MTMKDFCDKKFKTRKEMTKAVGELVEHCLNNAYTSIRFHVDKNHIKVYYNFDAWSQEGPDHVTTISLE